MVTKKERETSWTNNIVQNAFQQLYPKKIKPKLTLSFSKRFNYYNGNVKIHKLGRTITGLNFSLSNEFRDSDEDTIMGMIQHLLNKVYKTKVNSLEQELYNNFMKHLTRYAKRQKSEPQLIELFHELNREYFNSMLDKPNLVFGVDSTTVLGHYNFLKDLVTISTILKGERHLMKFVLYHELLHKKHGFTVSKGGRNQYHTTAFKKDEAKFEDKYVEKKLTKYLKKKKIKKILSGW